MSMSDSGQPMRPEVTAFKFAAHPAQESAATSIGTFASIEPRHYPIAATLKATLA
jgi:hypothetical protein